MVFGPNPEGSKVDFQVDFSLFVPGNFRYKAQFIPSYLEKIALWWFCPEVTLFSNKFHTRCEDLVILPLTSAVFRAFKLCFN